MCVCLCVCVCVCVCMCMYILHVVLGAVCGCVYIIGTEKGRSTFYIPPFFHLNFYCVLLS